jgi:hypothetical protein
MNDPTGRKRTMQAQPEAFTEESFGKCATCGSALSVDGEDRLSAIDPDRLIGTTMALPAQSDDGRFATRLRCENGHTWWMLTTDMRESV